MSTLRFICDEQLGRLAKWLRLQGFDTLYECPIADSRLIQLAQSEARMILTRDRHLSAKTLWESILLIEATHYGDQLRELREKARLPKTAPFSRCLDCNFEIKSVSKAEVRGKVPEEVYELYGEFYHCPKCRKIFWQGTHVKNSKIRLQRFVK